MRPQSIYQQMIAKSLARAQRHVTDGAKRIEHQQETLTKLQSGGHAKAAQKAAEVLILFEETQAKHLADRDRLLRERHRISK